MKKKFSIVAIVASLVFLSYLTFTTVDSTTPAAVAAGNTQSGTIYVSAMGGHFAVADVTIDASKEQPITVNNLEKIDIGDKSSHPTHDPRIDANDRTKMFWSTYKLDKDGNVHVGMSDLKTGKVVKDVAVKLDPRAKWTGALYCASGQTASSYLPVTMTDEAYIDVFDKKTLAHKHRVFLDYKAGQTKFYHGTNSPDMKKFVIAVNLADEGKLNGKIDMIMLDLPALEKGKAKILAKNQITGEPGKTITFRSNFTNDGKFIVQSARDRMYILDGNTLKVVKEEMVSAGENHDVMTTADDKYAVLSIRENKKDKDGKDVVDGTLQLFDMQAKKLVGKTTSTCFKCHENMGINASAILCGIDANWKK